MAEKRDSEPQPTRRRREPARTPEGRENQLISAAVDLAEKQLREGTASAQVISFYLKMGSQREQLEQERLRSENALLIAKVEQLKSQQGLEEIYRNAMDAMVAYSGKEPPRRDDEQED